MDAQEMVTHLVDEFGDWIDGDDPVDWQAVDAVHSENAVGPVTHRANGSDWGEVHVRFESGAKLKITVESYEGEEV